jgi:hypothetical protein
MLEGFLAQTGLSGLAGYTKAPVAELARSVSIITHLVASKNHDSTGRPFFVSVAVSIVLTNAARRCV